MTTAITYTQCPVCSGRAIGKALVCRDYTVSQEQFEVWECAECRLRFTQQAPGDEAIGKYYQSENYISHSDTGQGLVNKLYKIARRYTLTAKQKLVIAITGAAQGNLLDVGCGTGAFIHKMQQAGWQVTGLEPDTGARQKAKELYGIKPLPSQELFQLNNDAYNAITMWHVLEHVHDLHVYMARFNELLAANGKLIIAVPNYTSTDAGYYKAHWAAYDVPRHLYHFSPTAMQKLAKQHGFTISRIKPMPLDAFYIAILSEQYKNGKGNLLKALWRGISCFFATLGNKEKSSSLIYILEKAGA